MSIGEREDITKLNTYSKDDQKRESNKYEQSGDSSVLPKYFIITKDIHNRVKSQNASSESKLVGE